MAATSRNILRKTSSESAYIDLSASFSSVGRSYLHSGSGSFGTGRGASYLINLFPRGPQGPQRFSFSVYRRLSSITPSRYSLLSWMIIRLILSIFHLLEILAKVDLVMIPSTRGTLPALDV